MVSTTSRLLHTSLQCVQREVHIQVRGSCVSFPEEVPPLGAAPTGPADDPPLSEPHVPVVGIADRGELAVNTSATSGCERRTKFSLGMSPGTFRAGAAKHGRRQTQAIDWRGKMFASSLSRTLRSTPAGTRQPERARTRARRPPAAAALDLGFHTREVLSMLARLGQGRPERPATRSS